MASIFTGAGGKRPMMAQVRDRRRLRNRERKVIPSTTGMTERLMHESNNGDVWARACDLASRPSDVKHQAVSERSAANGAEEQGSYTIAARSH